MLNVIQGYMYINSVRRGENGGKGKNKVLRLCRHIYNCHIYNLYIVACDVKHQYTHTRDPLHMLRRARHAPSPMSPFTITLGIRGTNSRLNPRALTGEKKEGQYLQIK